MATDAEAVQPAGPPKRRLRNFVLDARFQLKYTGMVVLVTIAVAAVLGYFAYDSSKGQTESLMVQIASQPDLAPETVASLEGLARDRDREVLTKILTGILLLALTLGATGIVVTHKVVGPAYKLKRLFGEVERGHLKVGGTLRKGDELQDVFVAFEQMVKSLRERQDSEVKALDEAIRDESGGTAKLEELRDRMKAALK